MWPDFQLGSQPGDLDRHQNLFTFLSPSKHLNKISLQSVYNFLSNVANRQTETQTNKRHQKHNPLFIAFTNGQV